MRSAPIRLTKYESGFLLEYIEDVIKQKESDVVKGGLQNSIALELTSLYDLHKKIDNAFKKCEYIKAYSRKEE